MSYSVQDRQALEQCTSFELESTDIEVNPGMYSFLLYRALPDCGLEYLCRIPQALANAWGLGSVVMTYRLELLRKGVAGLSSAISGQERMCEIDVRDIQIIDDQRMGLYCKDCSSIHGPSCKPLGILHQRRSVAQLSIQAYSL